MNSCGNSRTMKNCPQPSYGCCVGLRVFRFYLFSCSRMHIHDSQRSTFHHTFFPIYSNRWHCCRYRSSASSFSTAPHIFQVICPNECILNISFVSLISFKCTTIFFPSVHIINWTGMADHTTAPAAARRQSSLIYAIYSSTLAQSL